MFLQVLDKMKLLFIETDDIRVLNKISLLFSSFSIHSSVPLVISKITSGNYNKNGGTLLYALKGLRIADFREELMDVWKGDISYEMQEMLRIININPPLDVTTE